MENDSIVLNVDSTDEILQNAPFGCSQGNSGNIDTSIRCWDYVFAFSNPAVLSENHNSRKIQHLVHKLKRAGLEVEAFYSDANRNGVKQILFMKVRATVEVLLREADRINMPMLIDSAQLETLAHRGIEEYNIKPFPVEDVHRYYKYSPYEYIYMQYDKREDLQPLFARKNQTMLFSNTQRMNLIESIFEYTGKTGAGLNISHMAMNGELLACYPIHQQREKQQLLEEWKSIPILKPWKQPIESIRQYFGAKIALYFAFLSTYTTSLFIPALFGILVSICQGVWGKHPMTKYNRNTTDHILDPVEIYSVPVYGGLIILWAVLFLEHWKRNNATIVMKWGMSKFKQHEGLRVQFTGIISKSPITGLPIKYFPTREKIKRRLFSWSILLLLLSIVILGTAAIFYLRYYCVKKNPDIFVLFNVQCGSYIAAIANVIQIYIMFKIYDRISLIMNEYENHATETAFEKNFILKAIIFHFVNNYTALFYVAFLKVYVEDECRDDDCLTELKISLAIVYGSQLVIGNCKEIFITRVWNLITKLRFRRKLRQELRHQARLGQSLLDNANVAATTTTNMGAFTNADSHTTTTTTTNGGRSNGTGINTINNRDVDRSSRKIISINKTPAAAGENTNVHSTTSPQLNNAEHSEVPYLEDRSSLDRTPLQQLQQQQQQYQYRTSSSTSIHRTSVEDQFFLAHYGWKGTFDDYLEMVIQFGFTTFFVVSFPITPFLSLCNNLLEIRIDSYRLMVDYRRPRPRSVVDIGLWIYILELFTSIAIFTNAGVIVYTSHTFYYISNIVDVNYELNRFELFVGFIAFMILLRLCIAVYINDTPQSVRAQLQRNEYFINKIFYHQEDESIEMLAITEEDLRRDGLLEVFEHDNLIGEHL